MTNRTVNGIDWHYQEKGTGYPLVLLHAYPVDSRLYVKQLEGLSKWYRVIAPDLPGFGETPYAGEMIVKWAAEQVHALLKEIGALPCVIGGCSMGGYITMAFEREFPTVAEGLVLIDTRAEGDNAEQQKNRVKMIEMADRHGPSAIAEAMLPKMLAQKTKTERPELESQIKSMILTQPVETLKSAMMMLRDRPDRTDFLPSVASPTLILVGAEDQVTPLNMAQVMKALIPKAELKVIPSAGHLSPIENPTAVNDALREFMTKIENCQRAKGH